MPSKVRALIDADADVHRNADYALRFASWLVHTEGSAAMPVTTTISISYRTSQKCSQCSSLISRKHQEGLRLGQPNSLRGRLLSSGQKSFARSDVLSPPSELEEVIGAEYEAQCRLLCYGPYPTWPEAKARFLEIRELL
jgi:hypothetical protein